MGTHGRGLQNGVLWLERPSDERRERSAIDPPLLQRLSISNRPF